MTTLAAAPAAPRLAAIDRLRGLVMVLMCSDHASHVFYADGLMRDSAFMPGWDRSLPVVPFLFRWASHLCAPTFVFLAGVSLALAAARRAGRPGFDRDLALRGLLLIGIEFSFISWVWGRQFEVRWFCQVLWALGSSMLCMVVLRRLPSWFALCASAAGLACYEWPLTSAGDASPGAVIALLFSGGFGDGYAVVYPTLPWLVVMWLGHAFGRGLLGVDRPSSPSGEGQISPRSNPITARAASCGLFALGVWITVKLADGYGNLGMRGVHDSWLRWLQCSKYPPSLAFLGLELGLALLLLAGFSWRAPSGAGRGLLVTLGRSALLFYVLHIALLEGAGFALNHGFGIDPRGGLGQTLLATAITVLVAWPLCSWFQELRQRHPDSLLRLI